MVFNVADNGSVVKKTAYIVYGIDVDGHKDILGLWVGEAESAKFWMSVLSDIKERGVKDILIPICIRQIIFLPSLFELFA